MAVPDVPSAHKAVEVLQSYGPACVVLTLGEKGVLFTPWGGKNTTTISHFETEKVEVVDSTVSCYCGALIPFHKASVAFHQ